MRIAVAVLQIVLPNAPGDKFLQQVHYIGLYRFVPVLLDHDACGSSLNIDIDQSVLDPGGFDFIVYQPGDVVQAFAFIGSYADA